MDTKQPTLTTERSTLEPLGERHTEPIVRMFADPEMSRYFPGDLTVRQNAEAMVRRRLAYSGPPELGHWVFLRDGVVIGLGHLRPSWELPGELPEIGWYLATEHGGAGLATEAGRALLHYGLNELGLDSVWALVHTENAPSLRLAQRLGFLRVGSGVHYGQMWHHVHVALPGRVSGKRPDGTGSLTPAVGP
ncbi:GNAT family N-acetyltransferase [Saccharomonospora saliphila]|uniref:GNAT family N-acetyltransferase n=1 Tax=Saccharomonospora saliphila TaxID=369829 RepID=UPI000360A1AD|nr:GNAT family N-acetyltransferase [Saccharomonospora saliphila]